MKSSSDPTLQSIHHGTGLAHPVLERVRVAPVRHDHLPFREDRYVIYTYPLKACLKCSLQHCECYVLSDAVYELQGPDLDGNDKLFRKPWAMATNMFIGMSFCIPLFYLEESRQRRRSAQSAGSDASAPLLNGGDKVMYAAVHRSKCA